MVYDEAVMKVEQMHSSIATFWDKLKTVQALSLRSTKENSWQGFAKICVTSEGNNVILFHEKGEWENNSLSFTNTLRWTLHAGGISLEHLRFGSNFPVSLVEFTLIAENSLVSINPYLCGADRYSANIFWDQDGIQLHWNVQGPLKNEEIHSHYRFSS